MRLFGHPGGLSGAAGVERLPQPENGARGPTHISLVSESAAAPCARSPLVGVVGGVGVGRVLNAVAASLGLHHDLAFAHLALPVEDRDQRPVGRAAYHVGTIGEAFDDPRQILGRLLPRALWGIGEPLTFLGCQKGRVASRRPLRRGRKGAGHAADGRPPGTPVRWCRSRIRSAPRGPGARRIWRPG